MIQAAITYAETFRNLAAEGARREARGGQANRDSTEYNLGRMEGFQVAAESLSNVSPSTSRWSLYAHMRFLRDLFREDNARERGKREALAEMSRWLAAHL